VGRNGFPLEVPVQDRESIPPVAVWLLGLLGLVVAAPEVACLHQDKDFSLECQQRGVGAWQRNCESQAPTVAFSMGTAGLCSSPAGCCVQKRTTRRRREQNWTSERHPSVAVLEVAAVAVQAAAFPGSCLEQTRHLAAAVEGLQAKKADCFSDRCF